MATATEPPQLKKYKKGERVVETITDKNYYVCGKKTNKNVWELQQLYENTQAKTTHLIPEFLERIRFLIVKGICKASYNRQCDQNGEMFNFVVEELANKIVPKKDPNTGKLVTKYDCTKTNLGNYILNSCYWSVVAFQNTETWFEQQVSCGDFMEDYSEVSEKPHEYELKQLKFVSAYEPGNEYIELVQAILEGDKSED